MDRKSLDDITRSIEGTIKQETELGAVMRNLDADQVDEKTQMSSIDFNARLTSDEINACLIIDELIRLGLLPKNIGLTRQKKRLSVSKDGLGRTEKRDMVAGRQDLESGKRSWLAGMFKRQPL